MAAPVGCIVPGLDQFVDNGCGGDDADRQTLLAASQPQSESNVRLPGAAVADRDGVVAVSNVLAAGEFQDQCLVERRDRRDSVNSVLPVGCARALEPSRMPTADSFQGVSRIPL
jgi:hypothetical protein